MHNEPKIQEINSDYANGHEPLTFGFKAFQNTGPEKNIINSEKHAEPGKDPIFGCNHHKAGVNDGQIHECPCVTASLFQEPP